MKLGGKWALTTAIRMWGRSYSSIYCGRAMATLSELTDARERFRNLTLRELRGKYKRSALGWAWSLVNPLATMAIFAVVFHFVLKIDPPRGRAVRA